MGIVEEVGTRDLVGSGRPPVMLSFNCNYGYIIVIDLAGDKIRLAIGDLMGNTIVRDEVQFALNANITSDDFFAVMSKIQDLLKQEGIPNEKVHVVCVGAPGIINKNTGYFQVAPRYKEWNEINIRQLIEREFQSDVIVMNDINLSVIGESRYGAGRGFTNLLGISIDVGIGAGMIIQGQLYEGSRLAAGEVGYWVCDTPNMDKPEDLHSYFLDYRLSLHGLIGRVKQDLENGQESKILDFCQHNLDKVTFEVFCRAVESQDPYCMKKTHEMVQALAVVLSNMSLLLDLELIVIGGEIIKLGYAFIQPLREMVNRLVPLTTTIVFSELGERSGIYGGFAVSMDHVLNKLFDE